MSRRRCPLCDGLTDEVVCPRDRMATLLASAPPSQAPLPQPGMILAGRYELEGLVGRGGHGQIFAARHLGTGQRVALKILLPPADTDEDFAIKRFFLEARATSGLTHPNTVRVFDFGQDDSGLLYLALELLSGMTLRQELKVRKAEGRVFSEREAIDVGVAITRSLAEAHAARLVHRDLKPENVFLHRVAGDEPVVKVLDFGIAKLGGSRHTLSTPTSVPGTPAYMSPEQALTGDVDGRSDLYSLGVILFQLVTGELPFHGPSDPQTLYMHAYQPPPDLRTMAKTRLSDAFVRVVARALEKDRGRRWADARELREALLMARDGDDATLPPSSLRGAARAGEGSGREGSGREGSGREGSGREGSGREGRAEEVRMMAAALVAEPGAAHTPHTTSRVPLEAKAPGGRTEVLIGVAAVVVLALGVAAALALGYARSEAPRTEPTKAEAPSAADEAARVEAAKVDAAKVEAARVAKVEAARVEAAKLDAAKVEAAKVEAARLEAGKLEAAKLEAAKLEAAKLEAARAAAKTRPRTTVTQPPAPAGDDILQKRLEDLVPSKP